MSLSSEIAGTIEEHDRQEPVAGLANEGFESQEASNTIITLNQRMLSACTGSLLTSLVVTPFDVVRIRLQQQQILLPQEVKSSDGCCKQVFWQEVVADSGKKTVVEVASKPPDHFCEVNSCAQDMKIKGTFSGISKIYTAEGFPALYRGLSLVLLMAIPSNVVYFSGYEYLRDTSPIKSSTVINPLLCGALARVLSATAVAPIELLKTRLQAIPTSANLDSKKIMSLVLRNSYREIKLQGVGSLFRGLQITLWRDVPFSGIYWSSYEFVSSLMKKHIPYLNFANTSANSNIDSKIFLTSFLSGSISGIIAALLTNPFDVGKTRLQVSAREQTTSMFGFLYQMVKTEGIRSLYVGLLPRCMKIAPSCAIMISTYELSKKFFSSLNLL